MSCRAWISSTVLLIWDSTRTWALVGLWQVSAEEKCTWEEGSVFCPTIALLLWLRLTSLKLVPNAFQNILVGLILVWWDGMNLVSSLMCLLDFVKLEIAGVGVQDPAITKIRVMNLACHGHFISAFTCSPCFAKTVLLIRKFGQSFQQTTCFRKLDSSW